jgi:ABC-type polysaccharide/polyol phosphate transport system ATPase subunit
MVERRSGEIGPVVRLEDVTKGYRVYRTQAERLKRLAGMRAQFHDKVALDSVSLSIYRGEAVGLIGDNGAGKSTLLKIVAGTTAPSCGNVDVQGRLTAILELGAGFHPEFSGRENARLYGALVGLDASEMEERLDAILDFSELGRVVEDPVKSYSTGMMMRLAFAVATHVDPEILVVDEALAVGDGYFQKKCVDRILQMKDAGTTVLFCSHALYLVSTFCDRAVWLDRGAIRREGPTHSVVEAYEAHLLHAGKKRLGQHPVEIATGRSRTLSSTMGALVGRIKNIILDGGEQDGDYLLKPHDGLDVEVEIESLRETESYHLGISLDTSDGRCLLSLSTQWDKQPPFTGRREHIVRLSVPTIPVASGRYSISVFLLDETGLHVHDQAVFDKTVCVDNERWTPAVMDVDHSWEAG